MKALTYRLRLKEPLLATQTDSGEPNSASAGAYVPGSLVRGAVLARLFPEGQLDPAKTDRKYFDGTLRFLNAYPAYQPADGASVRLLPAPRAWRTDKDAPPETRDQVADLSHGATPVTFKRPERFGKPAAPRFVWLDAAGDIRYRTPQMRLTVHNASDDRNEKRAGPSQVYRYAAIAEGEMLAGAILGPELELLKLAQVLQGTYGLGGSRTGGYGRVAFVEITVGEWREVEPAPNPPADQVVITLLSDAIVRTAQGGFANTLDGVLHAEATAAFVEMKVAGGFNRKWGLPLPQLWAMAAGSVFVYPALDPGRLAQISAEGVGERPADGFGRVAVNWHTQPLAKCVEVDLAQTPEAAPPPLDPEARQLAQRMAERQLRADLEQALVRRVMTTTVTGRVPSPAQLARVRLAARQALFQTNLDKLQPVLDYLHNLFGEKSRPKRGAQQLDEAYVDGQKMLDWLGECAELKKSLALEKAPPVVAGVAATYTAALQVEFTARLIDGVMKRAIKQQQKDKPARKGGAHA